MDVSTRALRTFAILAEELHFGRAAERLGVAQPAVSQQLQRLESAIGVRLVDRSGRRVVLTDAGEAFLPEAIRAVESAGRASDAARSAWRGELGILRIGLTAGTPSEGMVSLLREHAARWPDVTVQIRERPQTQVLAGIADGTLDVGVVAGSVAPHTDPSILFTVVCRERVAVALHAEHPLAGRRSLSTCELTGESFSLIARDAMVGQVLRVEGICARAGFDPTAYAEVHDVATQLAMVGTGRCIAVVADGARRHAPDDVVLVPLEDATPVSTFLAYRDRSLSRALRTFLTLAPEVHVDAAASALPA
ncbi:transcriptional regulator LysR family [Patulibacter medicamentivorans]|uniref:Transcriptional regulator LysR family n=1 Tax=Patulibacter medicamentivorans TaxID=1097667 RepID=H0E257_9ACTN|nr:LysR substrate-binding domain-containing protein [Patulibacter medicamentivorans]EHN12267.1 transcriptional regulator LysR family [Patulibacter medicamentivorans]